MAERTLTDLTDGSFLLEEGIYTLEPGSPVVIKAGDSTVTLTYDYDTGEMVAVLKGAYFPETKLILADDVPEPPEPDSYSYCSPAPVTALDEHMNPHTF